MSKQLVVYYSRTGTTKTVAELISNKLKCDIVEVTDNINRKGPLGYIRCGKEAMTKKLPKINGLKKDPASYEVVIIGTPIWGFSLSSPIRSFLTEYKDKLKKVSFFCTQGGSGGKNAFSQMEKITEKKPIAAMILDTIEIKKEDYELKLDSFINKLI
ncbi:MAG: flavodoxin [Nanoarchaeota archaeon]